MRSVARLKTFMVAILTLTHIFKYDRLIVGPFDVTYKLMFMFDHDNYDAIDLILVFDRKGMVVIMLSPFFHSFGAIIPNDAYCIEKKKNR
jgi:hypothetical protein